jgi:HTH-type transcriptional regulator / antitoxin MqsA
MNLIRINGFNSQGENNMNKCHVCGSTEFSQELVNEVFYISRKPVFVENIPSTVCNQCGEQTFSRQTTEQIRVMLHSKSQPVRAIAVDVFSFA